MAAGRERRRSRQKGTVTLWRPRPGPGGCTQLASLTSPKRDSDLDYLGAVYTKKHSPLRPRKLVELILLSQGYDRHLPPTQKGNEKFRYGRKSGRWHFVVEHVQRKFQAYWTERKVCWALTRKYAMGSWKPDRGEDQIENHQHTLNCARAMRVRPCPGQRCTPITFPMVSPVISARPATFTEGY